MTELNNETKKDLQSFVDDIFNIETVESLYNISMGRIKDLYKDKPDEWHALTIKSLEIRFKKSNASASTVEFEGYIVGISDLFDAGAQDYTKAEALFKANPQQAIIDKVTDGYGIPLQTNGFNAGKPMAKHNYATNYIGVASVNSKNPKVFELVSWTEKPNETVELRTKVRFNVVLDTNLENKYILKTNDNFKPEYDETINLPPFENVKGMLDKTYLIPTDDIPKHLSKTKNVMIEGVVLNVVKNDKAHILKISDFMADKVLLVNVWMPKTVNIPIGQGSKVKVIGTLSQKVIDEKETDYFMNFKGFVPVDMVAPPAEIQVYNSDFNSVKATDTPTPTKTAEESLPDSVIASNIDEMESDIEL